MGEKIQAAEIIKIVHTQKIHKHTLKADKSHKRSLLPAKSILFCL